MLISREVVSCHSWETKSTKNPTHNVCMKYNPIQEKYFFCDKNKTQNAVTVCSYTKFMHYIVLITITFWLLSSKAICPETFRIRWSGRGVRSTMWSLTWFFLKIQATCMNFLNKGYTPTRGKCIYMAHSGRKKNYWKCIGVRGNASI